MADATQLQIRRDTATNLNSTTPVEAEPGYDQTNKRFIIGDGSTQGGIPHLSYNDARSNTFLTGSVGGTANAITLAMNPSPSSYVTNMEVIFQATASNTNSTTININGIGNRTIQKLKSGTLQNLDSGDIISGIFYKIIYNGTVFQLITVYGAGLQNVSQGDLNTSTGTFSSTVSSGGTVPTYSNPIVLPGGQYGFGIESSNQFNSISIVGWIYAGTGYSYTSSAIAICFVSGPYVVNGRQRYITSSPPYDLGDGSVGGFFFALVDSEGKIVSHYAADAPPWAYNGPTKVRADYQCPVTNKKFREVIKKRSFEEIMDGASIQYKMEEITQKIKNKDMGLIPHPFGNIPHGHHVVLFDPMDDKIRRIIEYQNATGGDEFMEEIVGGKFSVGDECKRCCPKSVHVHKLNYKYTGKF